MVELLTGVDIDSDMQLDRVSQHDRYLFGARGEFRRVAVRQVLRARADGPDRIVTVFDGEISGTTAPTLYPGRNCKLGRHASASSRSGLVVAELVLPRPLSRGETAVLEYQLIGDPAGLGLITAECSRRFRAPIREYLLEIDFHQASLPSEIHRVGTAIDGSADRRRPPVLDDTHGVHTVELDVGPGTAGLAWRWPTSPPGTRPASAD
ncbi:hypothetical protein [Actinoalloteichus hymeniacidonis]|uniref:hypothetical protein n=1 Tax=Actinoalloteichus hymeniacidonis TaxID=340345 RepID=UPI0012FB7B6C|nr:hypothetical protein [Actinoalloteichus hymeniacidonis]MBB5906024.1 hypothetical protein [Actinoalloteichus hymeniacidonis]